ncbi:(S)-2,3-di-O-geranylgeranylglyceryl phosphate synthase [Rosistilla carotiformis]|uniref:(S)-2,3-di-O-geranylgeranylglyceryl phosphate synthase n=1 Tax=Rosistilla carotiformis TaxID=2528017 RepID=A0A518JLR1_9BACT|nr:UbiA family prenyltransferase [Rosistilla carotiformis]QDV66483.1 (S)-2,3-di-O-geranylgeranylglyceryl phosphate synthase [Rosistilla carotiformis]
MSSPSPRPSLRDWCQLVRLPNVFTVVADTTAAFLLVAHELAPLPRYAIVLAAVVCIYWAGMILNDVWDIEIDRKERSKRPLPAGKISLSAARRAGWGLLLAGIALSFAVGFISLGDASPNLVPGGIAVVLAAMVVLYDGPIKRTPLAPMAMGACRFFSFLLGASAAVGSMAEFPFLPLHVLAIAAGFGVYIVGVTCMARGEAVGGQKMPLIVGLVITIVGMAMIAGGPQFAPADAVAQFQIEPRRQFSLLIGLLAFTIIHRAFRAIVNPEPYAIQMNIKHAILTLIPLSAAVALLASGPLAGLLVFALAVPAMMLGSFLRIT